jgi:tripartite-type tricarboxylate transporter receptor subunit TctC
VAEVLPGFVAGGWNVLLAPVSTPDAIIKKASVDLRKALDDAELKKKLGQLGAYLHPMTPAEVTAFAQDQQRTWRPVAEKVAKDMAQPPK